jgi:hypothetical protein
MSLITEIKLSKEQIVAFEKTFEQKINDMLSNPWEPVELYRYLNVQLNTIISGKFIPADQYYLFPKLMVCMVMLGMTNEVNPSNNGTKDIPDVKVIVMDNPNKVKDIHDTLFQIFGE